MLFGSVVIEFQRKTIVIVNQTTFTTVNEIDRIWKCPDSYRNIELILSFPDLIVNKSSFHSSIGISESS